MPKVTFLLTAFARPFRWMARTEKSGRFIWSLLLADGLLISMAAVILNRYWPDRPLGAEDLEILTTGILVFHLASLSYVPAWPLAAWWQPLKLCGANLLAALVFPRAFVWLELPLDRADLARVLLVCTPLQILLQGVHRRYRGSMPLEPLRWTLLAAGGCLVGFPFSTTRPVGTGDAYWYGNMVGDFVTQWRAGIFPVFVGQSDYAFNGAVSPLRFAPYLQHAAGVFDLLALHALSPVALLNLTLFLSLLAAVFTTYITLVAIGKGIRWLATLLALLFISSPGVLSLAYTGDLFMSVCTLPYLPLVMYGIWLTFERRNSASVCFLAAALAATWLCHPPIAFWATVIAALSQVLRLAGERRNPSVWRDWAVGALVFVALTGYEFISVLTLKLPALAAEPTIIVAVLKQVFPAIFGPVSTTASELSDYQLGWSLWLVLLVGITGALRQPRGFTVALAAGCGLLLALLLPIPFVMEKIWLLMPQTIDNITFMWPMQRFYVLLAIMSVFLGFAAVAGIAGRKPWVSGLLAITLLLALAWSGYQADFFLARGFQNTSSPATAQIAALPQNRILTRYAFSSFPHSPPYYSHGYVDPLLENRLLSIDTQQEIISNHRALLGEAGIIRAEGPVPARSYGGDRPFFELFNAFPIEPGHHYALEIDFNHPELTGSLVVAGTTVQREYYLPDSGTGLPAISPSTAFGALPTSARSFSLRSTAPGTETLLLQFISSVPVPRDISTFGHYVLREFDPARLPVAVTGWTPYRANVTSPTAAFVETPRVYIDGYAAAVNKQAVPVSRSPGGLVMIPVGAGQSGVKLYYPGPLSLRVAYFFSLAAWTGVIAFGLFRMSRRAPVPAAA
jgi:hypothetical protein